MAIALVGSLGAASAEASPSTPAFGQSTTAGNLLIAWVRARGAAGIGVTGTGWTIAAGVAATPDTALVYYRANCGAGEAAPTFTNDLNVAQLGEFSGADTTAPLENNSGANATSATSPVADSCASADTATGNLVVSAFAPLSSKAETITTAITFTGGIATTVNAANNDATSVARHYRFAYGLTTTNTGADTASGSDTSMNITTLAIAIASFKVPTVATRVPRGPAVDSDFGVLCKAHRAVRRWRHGKHGILVPEFVH